MQQKTCATMKVCDFNVLQNLHTNMADEHIKELNELLGVLNGIV